ncbi:hypothetical protein K1719_028604 [Acacia pycnantha]|nr:hypothetical protein K1719_028604 [Acacia pycnantha]
MGRKLLMRENPLPPIPCSDHLIQLHPSTTSFLLPPSTLGFHLLFPASSSLSLYSSPKISLLPSVHRRHRGLIVGSLRGDWFQN